MADTSTNAALNLQAIIDQERKRADDAEKLAKSLVEEFTSCSDFDDVRQKFREKIKDIAPQALVNIVTLMNGAESESVRANLNKWVLEWAMSDKIDASGSELAQLLKGLQATPNS